MKQPEITNIDQLRVRIAMLKLHRAEQEVYFNQSFNKVSKAISDPLGFIKSLLSIGNRKSEIDAQEGDWVTNLAKIALPYLLNNTILKNSGFIIKSIISFISLNLINAQNINQNVLLDWFDKLMIWIDKKRNQRKQQSNDFGIPPDSETSSGKPVYD
jgi:hypothetical protein